MTCINGLIKRQVNWCRVTVLVYRSCRARWWRWIWTAWQKKNDSNWSRTDPSHVGSVGGSSSEQHISAGTWGSTLGRSHLPVTSVAGATPVGTISVHTSTLTAGTRSINASIAERSSTTWHGLQITAELSTRTQTMSMATPCPHLRTVPLPLPLL